MKLGQTSVVVFLSKLLASALGFFATLYFARELGAEVIGLYALVLTVVSWLVLVGNLGVGSATKKRISEGEEPEAYLSAAVIWLVTLGVVLSVLVVLSGPLLESYVSEFDQYIAVSVVWFVVAILSVKLFYETVFRVLKGERKVHISGLLQPVSVGGKALIQVLLVLAGYGLLGMLVGYALGGVLVGVVGLYWVGTRPARPAKRHFRSLFDYAKYSWLGKLESRAFNDVDILLLGAFVPSALVGVYSVAWSIAKFLELFGASISSAAFPEISYTSAQETKQAAAGVIEDSLAYTGLIAIPGLVGGLIIGDRLLRLYGPEFVEGTVVLGLLILATLLFSYKKQLLNAVNGIDRPDVAFRINAVFVALNVGLNVVLIPQFGIEGAAVASAVSTSVALVLSYRALGNLLEFTVPVGEITRQTGAAAVMGGSVWVALEAVETSGMVEHNAIVVVGLVLGGAALYLVTLLAVSSRFRETVDRNLPVRLPYLG